MLKKTVKLSALVLSLSAFAAAWCSAGVGTTGAQFLKIGTGARPVAMGNAFSAVADDINAIYWNPAGLALQEKKQASASYINYFQGMSIGFLGYSQKVSRDGAVGFGLDYLTVGDIDRRTGDTDLALNTFGANDMALYLSYANRRPFGSKLRDVSVGANLKFIRQTIDTVSAQSYALDVAALYAPANSKLTASLGVFNFGSTIKFVDESDVLPLDIRLGAAYRFMNDDLLVALDVDDYIHDGRLLEQLGLEYRGIKSLAARAGYKLGGDANKLGGLAGFTAGLGISVWNIQLDYAYAPFGELSDTHQISIGTKF